MIKAVIFDMDGLIVDSEPIHSFSLEKLLLEYGKKPVFNEQGLIHNVGEAGEESFNFLRERYSLNEDINVWKEKRRAIFAELVRKNGVRSMPGFLTLLKKLQKKKFKIALSSNRILDHVVLILDKLGVKDAFDVIVGPGEKLRFKPAPDIYLKTAELLNLQPNECIAIEDSEMGVIAGKKAGMKVIAIPSKYTKSHDFSNADKVVDSLSKITGAFISKL